MSVSTTTTAAVLAVEEASGVQAKTTYPDKPAKDKDEENEGTTVAVSVDMIDLTDPATSSSSTSQQHRYTKEQLLKLRQAPSSQRRPEYLSPAYDNANGIWDPERWHYDRKTSETPTENGNRSGEVDNHRRRSGDPRERLRKEQDGIVLSPQRRSFNSGCFVPVRDPPRSARPHSPLGKGETAHIGHREIPQGPGTRRIGSGRILPWDYQEKSDVDNEFGYRRERRDADRERDERFERRSFGRDFDVGGSRQKEKSVQRNVRYSERRRVSDNNREEEPEWFSEGPISQNDTIELRGFDESEKVTSKKKQTSAQKKKAAKERVSSKNNPAESQAQVDRETVKEGTRSTPVQQESAASRATPLTSRSPNLPDRGDGSDQQKTEANVPNEPGSFNMEDFLLIDTIPGLLTNGVSLEGGDTCGSKFSRWFSREKSPPTMRAEESRRSSIQDDHHHLIKNILNDISETNVTIPGDSESYFAPISPAASTGGMGAAPGGPPPASKPINLMEMLQRGKQQVPLHADGAPAMKNMEVPGKVLSLEELEARMMQGGGGDVGAVAFGAAHAKHNGSKNEEDNVAFKRLLAQVSGGFAVPASNGPIPQKNQPMSILEMLTHSQKQDEVARLAQIMSSAANPPPPHIANDLTYKLQQQQQQPTQQAQQQRQQYEILSKLMSSGVRQQPRTPPLAAEMGIAQSRELLSRPEAQAILQGLKRGDITPQHLYQQLANPAMQSRHRELLQTILKLQGSSGVGPSPRVLSPVPPPPPSSHPLFQQQQLRVSPLPPNAMHQRIPSPRELQVHTQNIMQRALIKKKLEEQQENYRKKQEMQQRGQSPGGGGVVSPAKNVVASPTQLAFTPTSVLRKMTADKEEVGKENNKNVADAQGKMPQGRAVTGMRSQQVQPQQSQQQPPPSQPQWSGQFPPMTKQPAGRPIVKNNASFQQQPTQQHEQFLHHRLFNTQQRKQGGQQFGGGQFGPQQFPASQQFSQLTQHQLRAQHQQQQQHVRTQHQQQQQQHQQNFGQYQWQQLLHNQNFDNRQIGRGGADGGDMSPTSNQLARWFSPDLLERARKGKLPNMPPSNLSQHALSLEEIERQAAPAVHN